MSLLEIACPPGRIGRVVWVVRVGKMVGMLEKLSLLSGLSGFSIVVNLLINITLGRNHIGSEERLEDNFEKATITKDHQYCCKYLQTSF